METETIFFVIIMVLLGSVLMYAIAILFRKPDSSSILIDASVDATEYAHARDSPSPAATESVPKVNSLAFKKYQRDMMHDMETNPNYRTEIKNYSPYYKQTLILHWWNNVVKDKTKIELQKKAIREPTFLYFN